MIFRITDMDIHIEGDECVHGREIFAETTLKKKPLLWVKF